MANSVCRVVNEKKLKSMTNLEERKSSVKKDTQGLLTAYKALL